MTEDLTRVTTALELDCLGLEAVVATPLGGRYVATTEWRGMLGWSFTEWPDDACISSATLIRRAGTLRVVSVA